VSLDLWEESSEDVRERWRDIARTLRDPGDAEALPRALQVAFWFGAEATKKSASDGRFDTTLRSLLPLAKITILRGADQKPPVSKPPVLRR
jgi:hypothetical protein